MRVSALGRAFGRRSEEQQSSARAHHISLGTFALESALSQVGGPPYHRYAQSQGS